MWALSVADALMPPERKADGAARRIVFWKIAKSVRPTGIRKGSFDIVLQVGCFSLITFRLLGSSGGEEESTQCVHRGAAARKVRGKVPGKVFIFSFFVVFFFCIFLKDKSTQFSSYGKGGTVCIDSTQVLDSETCLCRTSTSS